MSAVLSALSSWAIVVVLVVILAFVYALVRLVVTTRHPGDELLVRVFPPRIEVRYARREKAEAPVLAQASGREKRR
ncbi:hypothetical protein [Nocardia sp. CC227C]|uniref:hypothetical protein n=1 Tax=Nocardia sp. CC227C TaxID=3044562 RepID=UPI00278C3654|nr:hypothetical protein [Nocardia sp. CC227C]